MSEPEIIEALQSLFVDCTTPRDKIARQQFVADWIFRNVFPMRDQPIANVRWIPVEQVEANDYNPNSVAGREMDLLHTSISADGFTQPTVVIYDPTKNKYTIVDGFHRFTVMRTYRDIYLRCKGLLPVVVIEKPINDRMASTVRHNRARGKHSVNGMGSMVLEMLKNGWADDQICKELGMEADELVRLKHVTGFSKLFEDVAYRQAWETKNQMLYRKDYLQKHLDEDTEFSESSAPTPPAPEENHEAQVAAH